MIALTKQEKNEMQDIYDRALGALKQPLPVKLGQTEEEYGPIGTYTYEEMEKYVWEPMRRERERKVITFLGLAGIFGAVILSVFWPKKKEE